MPEAEARERDAELRGRDVAILLARVVKDALDQAGESIALSGARVDRRPRRADDRELGRDEHAVQQDQRRDDRELDHRTGSSAAGAGRNLRHLELVGDAAEQLGDDVFERDQAGDLAVAVDHERLVRAPLAQEREQPIGGHVVTHARRSGAAAAASDRRRMPFTYSVTRSLVCSMPTTLSRSSR